MNKILADTPILFGVHGTYAKFDGSILRTATGDPVSVGMADVTSATTLDEYRKTHPQAPRYPKHQNLSGVENTGEALTDQQKKDLAEKAGQTEVTKTDEAAGRNATGTVSTDEAKRLADEARSNSQK